MVKKSEKKGKKKFDTFKAICHTAHMKGGERFPTYYEGDTAMTKNLNGKLSIRDAMKIADAALHDEYWELTLTGAIEIAADCHRMGWHSKIMKYSGDHYANVEIV